MAGSGEGAAEAGPRGAFEVRDPEFRRRIVASFSAQGFMRTLGARLSAVEPGEVAIVLAVSEGLGQQHGYLHGGALMTIADSAAGYAAMTLMPPGDGVLTADVNFRLLRPVRGEAIRAVGRVVRPGRTLTVTSVDVHDGADGAGAHLATGLLGMMRMEGLG